MNEIIPIINIGVLTLTFIVIGWYTFETFKLRKINEKQIRINIMPLIAVVDIGNEIELKNIGKSPALNVTINPIKNRASIDSKEKFDFIVADSIPFLDVGQKKQIRVEPKPLASSGLQSPNPNPLLNPMESNFLGKYELKINYEDIEHKKMHTVLEVSKNRITFKEIRYNS